MKVKAMSVELGPKRKKPWWERLWEDLKPPSPKALGRAPYNALPSRDFMDEGDTGYTWEDWHEEVSKKYPVRYFITDTLPFFFRVKWRYVTEAVYWLKCKTLPSYRFHLLDLRNPGPGIEYTYGFRDKPEVMLWACFALLREYIEKEEPEDPREGFAPEELESEPLKSQVASYVEAKALYDWWMVTRLKEEKAVDLLYEHYSKRKKEVGRDASELDCKAWLEAEALRDRRAQEMLLRLVAIRESLWT